MRLSRNSTSDEGEYKDFANRLNLLCHRGPDGQSVDHKNLLACHVSLGHCRLAIIDLDSRADQPMHSPDGRYSLVFNGEILNYIELREQLLLLGRTFSTNSDTEVLLMAWAEWGIACIQKLEGMFSFVMVDFEKEKLFAVRDALGIKPLYWKRSGTTLSLASEIWPLVDEESRPNLQVAYDYLAMGYYDHGDNTFVEGVSTIRGGHFLTVDFTESMNIELTDWWNPDFSEAKEAPSEKDAVSSVKNLLLENMKLHLRSDVPMGFALSGGLDSSALVCLAREASPTLEITTVTYDPISRQDISERKWAELVNKHVGAVGAMVDFGSEELGEEIAQMVRAQGEPFASTRMFAQYKVFQEFAKRGVLVVIEGQGGDEVFAGYDGFPHFRVVSMLESGKIKDAIRFVNNWRKLPNHSLVKLALQIASLLPFRRVLPASLIYKIRASALGEKQSSSLNLRRIRRIGVDTRNQRKHFLQPKYRRRRVIEALLRALRETYIPQLLRQGDRNAMAWSIENRVPFLNKKIVERILSLPEDLVVGNDGLPKSFLRKALFGIVPASVTGRKDKVGFETPQTEVLNFSALRLSELSQELRSLGFFNPHYLRKFEDGDLQISDKDYYQWRVINLAIWLQQLRSFQTSPIGAK